MKPTHILVADDDPDLRRLVERILTRAGYPVTTAEDGQQALDHFFRTLPGLVILDITMPRLDGWTTLERIREASNVPIIMLTALAAPTEKVRALRGGADDYLTKPFNGPELIARIQAALRRAPRTAIAQLMTDGHLSIDIPSRAVTVDGEPVALTPLEFRLLVTLMQHQGELLSSERLCEIVWDDPTGISRDQVKLYVGYLRRKLAPAGPTDWEPIENVRGHGYRYRYELTADVSST
ncbi:MAG: response regulator transcription factor [Kineosporiaceae bacterium]|nr:response regulator transcription factor [Aeromicrobium sp.]